MNLAIARQFPALIWIYLIGTLFTRGSYYMVWPFLAVILYQQFALSATEVGLMLSVSAMGSSFIGFYVGNLSDRFGRRTLMLTGGFIGLIAYSLIAFSDSISTYAIAIALSSVSRAIWDAPSKALIGDLLPIKEERELAFHLAYFFVNVGAAIGPFVGLAMGLTAKQETFLITAASYFLLTVILYFGFQMNKAKLHHSTDLSEPFSVIAKVLMQDHRFLALIFANVLVTFIHSHCDSSLIQYLTRAETPDLLALISVLIMVNACTIVFLQFPLLKMMEGMRINNRIYIGLILLFISQIFYTMSPTDGYWQWIIGTLFLSISEAILFPTMNIQIDRMAPDHLRGSYFGATSFYNFGFASAPLLGGMILDWFSGPVLFGLTTVLCIAVIGIYLISHKLKRPEFIA